ncbi:2-nitropropane dioxygenase [Gammaproteobacteria bacterium 42_54_T18]|nr:2-nitropropane dioxygenase [Gammaproteobacteria bacterium 42_54_T18]
MTNKLSLLDSTQNTQWCWSVSDATVSYDEASIQAKISNLDKPCYFVEKDGVVGVSNEAHPGELAGNLNVQAYTAPISVAQLGDPAYRTAHGTHYAYYAGAMANGIASAELVIALGKAGILCSFGAGGCVPSHVESSLQKIQAALPNGPYAANLIHSPKEPALERGNVDLFLKYNVTTVEASAFLGLTEQVVRYRAAGLSQDASGNVVIGNRVIAKISRTEVARRFMEPAPLKYLTPLVEKGLITAQQAEWAQQIPMADDITAEADSGGHTDNRPLVTLLPAIIALRDEIQAQYNYPQTLRVGAGGGVGTPQAALATFALGADFIVTGSINQPCLESGSSDPVRKALAVAQMADVAMAPAADMFEMGVKLQVLKRGTLFPMRAQKLYDLYREYDSIDDIPADERAKIEKQIFRSPLEDIWKGTVEFFEQRDPELIASAKGNPKRKMALIFRWYLGLSSRWANTGEPGREMDYQIWAGAALGAFNAWVKGSYLEPVENRRAVDVATHIMQGAVYLHRVQALKTQGVVLPSEFSIYTPQPLA